MRRALPPPVAPTGSSTNHPKNDTMKLSGPPSALHQRGPGLLASAWAIPESQTQLQIQLSPVARIGRPDEPQLLLALQSEVSQEAVDGSPNGKKNENGNTAPRCIEAWRSNLVPAESSWKGAVPEANRAAEVCRNSRLVECTPAGFIFSSPDEDRR